MLMTIFIVVFTIQNSATVEIKLFFWGFETPRVLLIISLLFIGFLFGQFAPKIFLPPAKIHK